MILEFHDLAAEPREEWRRMLHFVNLTEEDRQAMVQSVEVLLGRSLELVVGTYDYLRSVPETAAILGWEQSVDEKHLAERRQFFSLWLARTIGIDTSDEFALYLFHAGKVHAGHGPRHIHTPSIYVTGSISLVLAAFSRFMSEADLPGAAIAAAMAGWGKYLSVQLNQMLLGYQVARELESGEFAIQVNAFGLLRPILGQKELVIHASSGDRIADLLRKFFNYYPQVRLEALDRVWSSSEKPESSWTEINPVYIPKRGWRLLLNGRDLMYDGGLETCLQPTDTISIFPPGR